MILQSLYPFVIISQQSRTRPYNALPRPSRKQTTLGTCAAVLGPLERRYDPLAPMRSELNTGTPTTSNYSAPNLTKLSCCASSQPQPQLAHKLQLRKTYLT